MFEVTCGALPGREAHKAAVKMKLLSPAHGLLAGGKTGSKKSGRAQFWVKMSDMLRLRGMMCSISGVCRLVHGSPVWEQSSFLMMESMSHSRLLLNMSRSRSVGKRSWQIPPLPLIVPFRKMEVSICMDEEPFPPMGESRSCCLALASALASLARFSSPFKHLKELWLWLLL
ncbi:hypothetical protein EYF80_025303 [Liparis tanakae]|uniref:Uncharacterized protein n=1 Tax=Liparis tanakae TaxID=230148 RepID=A0A4Z2HHY8_9TELE|nr:hypothetical protein EYF80_025303 [Liparis tanakae]